MLEKIYGHYTADKIEDNRCEHKYSVMWNEYNNVVQCHRCGRIYKVRTFIKKYKLIAILLIWILAIVLHVINSGM